MIDIFVYPVSAIMKFWHHFISMALGDSVSWLVSIIMLVVTVRAVIAPLSWLSVRSGRLSALMKPQSVALDSRLKSAESVDEMVAIMREQRDLKEHYGYNAASGCLPVFLIVPFFLGLYQTVLRMARVNDLKHVGVLNESDIASFREATLNGAPFTDYAGQHVGLVLPLLIPAISFTTLSMIVTTYRGYLTTRFDEKVGRRVFILMGIIIAVVPYLLFNAAVHGPLPVAVIVYWVASYLFTLLQTLVFELILRKKYPLTAEVHEYRREGITLWRQSLTWDGYRTRRREKKERKRSKKQAKKDRRAKRKEVKKLRRDIKAGRVQPPEPTGDYTPTRTQMHNRARAIFKEENKARKKKSKSSNPPGDQKA
ncbi:membrane protein insertase YidC [Corynebacterium phocae]|uniref:membrane protein insertase YidC n=1 Tax=Corynebacterium phocae TaxID=161895 RepID=UPI0009529B6D|nr:membrane protein insertase YidC [Corynebacterium phocae]KAA8721145.1 membrane protein insertase YidC [Corynebacterium phocae]